MVRRNEIVVLIYETGAGDVKEVTSIHGGSKAEENTVAHKTILLVDFFAFRIHTYKSIEKLCAIPRDQHMIQYQMRLTVVFRLPNYASRPQ